MSLGFSTPVNDEDSSLVRSRASFLGASLRLTITTHEERQWRTFKREKGEDNS